MKIEQLSEAVFQQFDLATVANLTGKDERTIARWKTGNLTPEAAAVLAHVAHEFGLLDPDILAVTERMRKVPPAKHQYLEKVLLKMRELKEQVYRTNLDKELPLPQHPLLKLAARYFERREFHPLADLVAGWSELGDFAAMPGDDQARALLFWGTSMSRQTFYAKAEEILRRALKLAEADKMRTNIQMELAIAVERMKRIPDARALLLECRERTPNDPVVWFNVMCFHARQQDGFENVDDCAKELYRLHPRADDPHDFIGEALRTDPDLAAYRRSELFRQRFRTLAFYAPVLAVGSSCLVAAILSAGPQVLFHLAALVAHISQGLLC